MFNETEISVLKNLAAINPSQIIYPNGFEVMKNSQSVLAKYEFANPYEFEAFGIYDLPEFLSLLGAFKDPTVEIKQKKIIITEGAQRATYITNPIEVMPHVPLAKVEEHFSKIEPELDFDLTADKLATIFKMAGIMKAEYLFFESDAKRIRITLANSLESSDNMYEVIVKDGIRSNDLGETTIKIPIIDMKHFPGDYTVKISSKRISRWENMNGIIYYVGCAIG